MMLGLASVIAIGFGLGIEALTFRCSCICITETVDRTISSGREIHETCDLSK
jgi:hypothetical protein